MDYHCKKEKENKSKKEEEYSDSYREKRIEY